MLTPKPITNSLLLPSLSLHGILMRHKLWLGLHIHPIHLAAAANLGLVWRSTGFKHPILHFGRFHRVQITDDGVFGQFFFGGGGDGLVAKLWSQKCFE